MSGVEEVLGGGASWSCVEGDCIAGMRTLPDECVHCCVTSPPYYGLRDYGTARWDGGDPACDHQLPCDAPNGNKGQPTTHPGRHVSRFCAKCGAFKIDEQIGLEGTPEAYVAKLVDVFREVRRVLHPSGTLWLNLGDSYARMQENNVPQSKNPLCQPPAGTGRIKNAGLKPKDLIGIPWMVAFALRADGWYLRQWCPWVKRNPMPESVTDRPGTGCETMFLLSKRSDYFFDMEAVKRLAAPDASPRDRDNSKLNNTPGRTRMAGLTHNEYESRNMRSSDLWFDSVGMLLAGEEEPELLGFDVTTKPYKGAHFAVMPKKLVEPCILAGTSAAGVCPKCGEPWVRAVKKVRVATRPGNDTKVHGTDGETHGNRDPERHCTRTETVGWNRQCDCGAYEPRPAVVLDPFAGSGTVLSVAMEHGRRSLGMELNPEYVQLIKKRMTFSPTPLFADTE